jgi:hypothetical protein
VKSLTAVAVALALLALPSTGHAQTELPVGEAHGVRVVREHRAIVVVLSAKLHKRYAGKNVLVSCTTLLEVGANIGSQVMRVPLHGRKLFTGDLTRPIDFCRVWRPHHHHVPKRLLVSVPLTQKGAIFVDEESKTLTMLGVLAIASVLGEDKSIDGTPTYDELVKALPNREQAPFRKKVVALGAPGDTPASGKVGYYSDGDEHIAIAILSASGRRLFIEYGSDDVFSTNVLSYMFNERE